MIKTLANLYFLTLLTVILTACEFDTSSSRSVMEPTSEQITETKSPKSTQTVEIIDFSGRTIYLDQPAKRVIALAPHIVENLYTIGAGDKIVGAVSHSDFPKEALELPIVGGYEKTNFEEILVLKPDVVIGWISGNSTDSLNKLEELGIPVVLDQPNTLDDIAKSLKMLGQVTGMQDTADEAAADFLEKLSTWRAANLNKRKVATFYQVWNEPLISINGNHIISDAIELCGGVNVFANSLATAPRTSIESIIDKAPEAIIASGMGEARPDWLDDWKKWTAIPAANKGNLFFVNPDHLQRHTVRQLHAIESICEQLDLARGKQ